MPAAPLISKRKYQQHGTPATRKLGHKLRGKTIAKRQAALEALYVDQARIAEIGVAPKYRNAIDPFHREVAQASWENRRDRWNTDHDVVTPPKVEARKGRRRNKTPRAVSTYRAERRNAAPKPIRGPQGLMKLAKPTHTWPLPDVPKLLAKERLAQQAAALAA